MFASLGVPAGSPDDRNGRGGIRDHCDHRLHGIGAGGLRRAFHPRARLCGRIPAQHVFGKSKDDGARPTRNRHGIGARDIFRNAIRRIDPRSPFGDRAEEGREIDFLKPFAVAHLAIHIADEQDHRLGILHGHVNADAGIGRAGTAGYKGDTRAACHRPVGAGHERNPAFLPTRYDVDGALLAQPVENLQEAFAGNREDPVAALFDQAIDKKLGGLRSVRCFHATAVSPRRLRAQSRQTWLISGKPFQRGTALI